jgi:hypothetical protein
MTLVISASTTNVLLSQVPDSARYRIYITVTDSVTGKTAKAALGFHPRATLGIDADTLFGFRDHWYAGDSSWQHEYPSPPLGFFQEVRIQNVRQKFPDNGLLFGNIHPYTGPSMVDTFIVMFNGDQNGVGDSLYLYTHPQIMTWPSVLGLYADSIILRDVGNVAQTTVGPYIHVRMTVDSTFTYFGDTYFNPDFSIYNVDPLHRGFFMYVYHPKISPAGPDPVALLSPSDGAAGEPLNETLQWTASAGAYYYTVELDSVPTFASPVFTSRVNSTSTGVSGLAANTSFYWRVSVTTAYGTSYYQTPPRSFRTTTSSGVKGTGAIPKEYSLRQNYPNPFNPSTQIGFSVPAASHVRIAVYDNLGRLVSTLVEGEFTRGGYSVRWDGTGANGIPQPSGVYFARMAARPSGATGLPDTRIERTIRMMIVK